MNETVEIKLSKKEYKTFLKFLYFADYCVAAGLLSEFNDTTAQKRIEAIISKIYKLGDKLGLPKSRSLTSVAWNVRFPAEDAMAYKQQIESDLDDISRMIFARELAKKELMDLKLTPDMISGTSGQLAISKRGQKFLKEFRKNGVTNLRFKMFYDLPDVDEEAL